MKDRYKLSFLIIPLIVLWAAPCLFGQLSSATGGISGSVTDPSGAAIAGASVTVTNVGTGVTYHAITTSDGYYTVKFLLLGTYRVQASETGFKTEVVSNVVVEIAANPMVNIKLSLGSTTQTVTVTATTSLLETERPDTGAAIGSEIVSEAPTFGRQDADLMWSSPGVMAVGSNHGMTAYGSNESYYTINGSENAVFQGAKDNYTIDGVNVHYSYNGSFEGFPASQDMTDEMKVVTDPFSAEYGHTMGGAIVIETKHGENKLHGKAWEYNRPAGLHANQFERNLAHQARLPGSTNLFGGQTGGRIIKDKLFFYEDWEGYWTTSLKSQYGTVPTQAQRQGDFTSTNYNSNPKGTTVLTPITIYDPFTCTSTTTQCTARTQVGPGDTYISGLNGGNPTVANVIPFNAFSPIAKFMFPSGSTNKFIPFPNAPGDAITGANNWYPTQQGAPSRWRQLDSRVDFNLNEATRLTFHEIHGATYSEPVDFYPPTPNPAVENTGAPGGRANEVAQITVTRTLSPTSLINVNVSMYRFVTTSFADYETAMTPAMMGFSTLFQSQAAAEVPTFTFSSPNGSSGVLGSGVWSGFGQNIGNRQPEQMNQLNGTWSKSLGRHSLHVGGEGILDRYYMYQPGNNAGAFSFSNTATVQNPFASLAIPTSQGNEVASFELGMESSATIDHNVEYARQNLLAAAFVQDDIKVSRRLTVNVGLRWDWAGGPTDRYNAIGGTFNTTVASPIATAVQAASGSANCPACLSGLKGGITFPGVNGLSRSPYDSSYRNFQPRLGFAYNLNSKTVLRAGWGLFYDNFVYDPGATGFSVTTSNTPFYPTDAPEQTLVNPFPSGLQPSTGSSLGLSTNLGNSLTFVDPQARETRNQIFNVNIQRLISPNTIVTVAMLYNAGSKVPISESLNYLPESAITPCLADSSSSQCYLTQSVTNPFAGNVPATTSLGKATVSMSQLLMPFPQYSSVTEQDVPIATSSYHALEVHVTRHLSHGFSFNIAYTNSKNIEHWFFQNQWDEATGKLEKSIAPYDMAQVLGFSGVGHLPIGRGQYLLGGMPRWADFILGGWQLTTDTQLQTGQPFSIGAPAVPGVDPYYAGRNLDHWLNPAAWKYNPAPYQIIGYNSYDAAARYPKYLNMNAGLGKSFKITERVKFTIRTHWYNVLNGVQFFNLSTTGNITSSKFGVIAGTQTSANYPRAGEVVGVVEF